MQHVICTGNLGSKAQYEELRSLAPSVHIVEGDYEYTSSVDNTDTTFSFPDTKVIQVGQFSIGVIHGHQVIPWGDHMALAMIRRKLNVDILVSGHTHQNEVVEHEGYYHINPVSLMILNVFFVFISMTDSHQNDLYHYYSILFRDPSQVPFRRYQNNPIHRLYYSLFRDQK